MKVLIAGATGFIGSLIVEQLLKKAHDVWVLLPDQSQLEEYQHMSVHAMVGNAAENGTWLSQLPDNLDFIVNAIFPNISVRLSLKQIENEGASHYFNVGKNLLYAAEKTGVKRMYQFAPLYCYTNTGVEITEKSILNRDTNTIGKLYMDLLPYLTNQKVQSTVLMHGLLYNFTGFTFPEIPRVAGRIPIIGGGENLLVLTHIVDLASACVFLLEKEIAEHFINVVDDKPLRQKEIMQRLGLKTQSGTVPLPKFAATPLLGDVLTSTLTESIQAKNNLLKSFGYWLKYPDMNAGFAASTI